MSRARLELYADDREASPQGLETERRERSVLDPEHVPSPALGGQIDSATISELSTQ